MNKHKAILPFLVFAAIATILWLLRERLSFPIYLSRETHFFGVDIVARWLAVAALVYYGFKRRSLTAWIVVGMVVGAEIGHDFPHFAVNLQVLSGIFLRLIKAIVAPLIFSTLVVGVAGHSDLKQVGRMGIKVLLYFEIVTTLALFIGLGTINLTKAGVGVAPPTDTSAASTVVNAKSE